MQRNLALESLTTAEEREKVQLFGVELQKFEKHMNKVEAELRRKDKDLNRLERLQAHSEDTCRRLDSNAPSIKRHVVSCAIRCVTILLFWQCNCCVLCCLLFPYLVEATLAWCKQVSAICLCLSHAQYCIWYKSCLQARFAIAHWRCIHLLHQVLRWLFANCGIQCLCIVAKAAQAVCVSTNLAVACLLWHAQHPHGMMRAFVWYFEVPRTDTLCSVPTPGWLHGQDAVRR